MAALSVTHFTLPSSLYILPCIAYCIFCFLIVQIFSTFYFLCVAFLLFKISINDSDNKTLPEIILSGAKCSFHRWEIGMRLAFPMC